MSGSSEDEKPMRRLAASFETLAAALARPNAEPLGVANFATACSHVSFLFSCLGIAFKFAESDYVEKVEDLMETSKTISTLSAILDVDIQHNCVRKVGSHSRNLLRVKRGIDMVKVLCELIITSGGDSLKDPASAAYDRVFAAHHEWYIRVAVGAGMITVPTKSQLLTEIKEDDASAKVLMQRFITACAPVILYVEELFNSRGLGIDW